MLTPRVTIRPQFSTEGPLRLPMMRMLQVGCGTFNRSDNGQDLKLDDGPTARTAEHNLSKGALARFSS